MRLHVLLVASRDEALADVAASLVGHPASGTSVDHVTSLDDARARLRVARYDVIIIAAATGSADLTAALDAVQRAAAGVPTVVLGALEDPDAALATLQQGAGDYLAVTQARPPLLQRVVRHVVERRRLESRLARHGQEARATRAAA